MLSMHLEMPRQPSRQQSRTNSVETVFLDRDGVINRKPAAGDYVKRWDEFCFMPRSIEAMRLLKQRGIRTVIVTNQRGIARGVMTDADLHEIHHRMQHQLATANADVHAIYYCADVDGPMRKPQPGMLLQARKDMPDIDFSTSAIIGDSLEDMAAGTRMGCRTIMIADPHTEPDFRRLAHQPTVVINAVAESLHDAVVRHVLQC